MKTSNTPKSSNTPRGFHDSLISDLNEKKKIISSQINKNSGHIKGKGIKTSLDYYDIEDPNSNQAPVPQRSKLYVTKPNNSP